MSLQLEHDRRILGSSEEPNWRTPKALVERLFEELPIVVDLAASPEDTVCEHWLGSGSDLGVDALEYDDWNQFIPRYAYGFLNPPYSRKRKMPIEPWIQRCWRTAHAGRGIVAVLPAAIQTGWWQEYVWSGSGDPVLDADFSRLSADEIRHLPHRVSFDHPDGETSNNANVNTAIVIWRPMRPFVGPWTPHVRYWTYR